MNFRFMIGFVFVVFLDEVSALSDHCLDVQGTVAFPSSLSQPWGWGRGRQLSLLRKLNEFGGCCVFSPELRTS